ncbi:MAG: lysylphosphatidylglycerol synthase transmembrane domain-containing protein [Chitinophagales bacterium]|nr:flippase-like domain-containing protein [Bacteroidota bacterium]MCB9042432.1 flippase-like domain-containing protein [Chitinophagales bacterium]
MGSKIKGALKIALFFAIGLALIWLSVKDISPEKRSEMLQVFRHVNVFWMSASILMVLLSHTSRSIRWQMLLEPVAHKPKLYNTFLSLMVGYFVNLALPRVGEATRTGLVSRYEKIPFNKVLATIVSDRILDLVLLAMLTFVAVVAQFGKLGNFAHEKLVQPLQEKVNLFHPSNLLLFGAVLVAIFLLAYFLKKSKKLDGLFHRLQQLFQSFGKSLFSIKDVRQPYWFVFHSIFIWVMYYFMIHFGLQAIESTSNLGFWASLSVLTFGTFGFILTPGGIGAYPLMVSGLLLLYGVPYEMGLAFGWVIWLVQTVLIGICGFISLLLLPVFNKKPLQASVTVAQGEVTSKTPTS